MEEGGKLLGRGGRERGGRGREEGGKASERRSRIKTNITVGKLWNGPEFNPTVPHPSEKEQLARIPGGAAESLKHNIS